MPPSFNAAVGKPPLVVAAEAGHAPSQCKLAALFANRAEAAARYEAEAAYWFRRVAGMPRFRREPGHFFTESVQGMGLLEGSTAEAVEFVRQRALSKLEDRRPTSRTSRKTDRALRESALTALAAWYLECRPLEEAPLEMHLRSRDDSEELVLFDYARERRKFERRTEHAPPALVQAAEGGDDAAAMQLGQFCHDLASLLRLGYAEAATWYRAAAEHGSAEGMCELGQQYARGLGTPVDLEQAALWLRRAAGLGSVPAQGALARLYRDGRGVRRNQRLAAHWQQKAHRGAELRAAQGPPPAAEAATLDAATIRWCLAAEVRGGWLGLVHLRAVDNWVRLAPEMDPESKPLLPRDDAARGAARDLAQESSALVLPPRPTVRELFELLRPLRPTPEEVRAILAWAEGRETLAESSAGLPTDGLAELDAAYEQALAAVMQRRVFGARRPAAARFQQYLAKLQAEDLKRRETDAPALPYAEKKLVVRTVNYWRARLHLELRYQGTPCRLSVKNPAGGEGGYQLRAVGGRHESLYAKTGFPPLECWPA